MTKNLVCFFLIFLCCAFMFFSFGNSQWSKYIFIWQAYYYPADGSLIGAHGLMYAPQNFSGTYRIWYENGVLAAIMEVDKGNIISSTYRCFDREGNETSASKVVK